MLRNKTDKYYFIQHAQNLPASMYHPSGYRIPDDEPILIFRAKDLGVLSAITAYMNMLCEQDASSTIKDHLVSMLEVTENIIQYQNRNNVKSVTCSIKAHTKTIKYLKNDVEESIEYVKKHLKTVYNTIID